MPALAPYGSLEMATAGFLFVFAIGRLLQNQEHPAALNIDRTKSDIIFNCSVYLDPASAAQVPINTQQPHRKCSGVGGLQDVSIKDMDTVDWGSDAGGEVPSIAAA
ncbi:hypothetical protein BKA57DRAFT_508609 [Linnemannia elongata]|nr:hypothetical protein BKA57DRAFT_508609 [Linnemannia elongata]